jgi:hypothetical protein
MVHALDGSLAMPPVPCPGGGGGPPTVADFDGDGLPELGVAGQAFYTIYDIDCTATPRPGGTCPPGPCDFGAPLPRAGYIALVALDAGHLLQHHRLERLRLRGRRHGRGGLRRRVLRARLQRQTGEVSSASTARLHLVREPDHRRRRRQLPRRSGHALEQGLLARRRRHPLPDLTPDGSTRSSRAALRDRRRLRLGRLRRRALPLHGHAECCARRDDAACLEVGLSVRAAPRRHAGRRQHLPRRPPPRRLGHPGVLRRQRQVGALAHDLEPARLRRHPRERGRHRPEDQRVEEQLGAQPRAQQLPPERARHLDP